MSSATGARNSLDRRMKIVGLRLLPIAVIVIAWVLGNTVFGVSGLILPSMFESFGELAALVVNPTFYSALFVTVTEFISAIVLASGVGLGLGFLLGRVKFI